MHVLHAVLTMSCVAGHYDLLNNAELGTHLHWYCQECNPRAIIAVKTDNDIEEKCKSYMSKFKLEISEEIQSVKSGLESRITEEVDRFNKEITDIKTSIEQGPGTQDKNEIEQLKASMREYEKNHAEAEETLLEEMRDREHRKLNLIIFNLPESKADDGKTRMDDDLESVRRLLAVVEVAVPISKATRLGRKGESTRPLRITTASITDQQGILKAAVKLRDSVECKDIFINRDQTPLEQKNWKELMVIRMAKIKESVEAGEENTNWVIRKGRVVNGRTKPTEI